MPNMLRVNGCSETNIVPESLSFAVAPGFFVGWHEVKRKQRPPGADAAGSVRRFVCKGMVKGDNPRPHLPVVSDRAGLQYIAVIDEWRLVCPVSRRE